MVCVWIFAASFLFVDYGSVIVLSSTFTWVHFGIMWSFLRSSSQALVHRVDICSLLVLVCREWRWISWTRIHVFHHVLAFSSLISFSVCFCFFFCSSMCISALGPSSSPSSSLVILFIHSASSLCFFGCHIFVQNCSVSLVSGCWYVFVSYTPSSW